MFGPKHARAGDDTLVLRPAIYRNSDSGSTAATTQMVHWRGGGFNIGIYSGPRWSCGGYGGYYGGYRPYYGGYYGGGWGYPGSYYYPSYGYYSYPSYGYYGGGYHGCY
jgi:hypothetical protein